MLTSARDLVVGSTRPALLVDMPAHFGSYSHTSRAQQALRVWGRIPHTLSRGPLIHARGSTTQEYGPDPELYLKLTEKWGGKFRAALEAKRGHEKQVVREALQSEYRRLHAMQLSVSQHAARLYQASHAARTDVAADAVATEGERKGVEVKELVEVHMRWQELEEQRQAVLGKAVKLSVELDVLTPATLGDSEWAMASAGQDVDGEEGKTESAVASAQAGATAAMASGAGRGGNKGSGRGVGEAGDGEAVKAACEICYSPIAVPDEHRTLHCIACAGASSEEDEDFLKAKRAEGKVVSGGVDMNGRATEKVSGEMGLVAPDDADSLAGVRRRQEVWTGVSEAASLEHQTKLKRRWEEQELQQEQLRVQQQQLVAKEEAEMAERKKVEQQRRAQVMRTRSTHTQTHTCLPSQRHIREHTRSVAFCVGHVCKGPSETRWWWDGRGSGCRRSDRGGTCVSGGLRKKKLRRGSHRRSTSLHKGRMVRLIFRPPRHRHRSHRCRTTIRCMEPANKMLTGRRLERIGAESFISCVNKWLGCWHCCGSGRGQ